MKASELRIGNLVTDEFKSSTITVDSINSKGIDLYIEDDGGWSELAQTWIEADKYFDTLLGIELTEEWLIKLGFEKEKDEPFNWSDKKKYLSDCFLIGHYSDGLHYVRNGIKTGQPLEYVHQLQNLYFSINGNELTP